MRVRVARGRERSLHPSLWFAATDSMENMHTPRTLTSNTMLQTR
jgi:predicted transcriptional regulator